jgi:hypothetical protein
VALALALTFDRLATPTPVVLTTFVVSPPNAVSKLNVSVPPTGRDMPFVSTSDPKIVSVTVTLVKASKPQFDTTIE